MTFPRSQLRTVKEIRIPIRMYGIVMIPLHGKKRKQMPVQSGMMRQPYGMRQPMPVQLRQLMEKPLILHGVLRILQNWY